MAGSYVKLIDVLNKFRDVYAEIPIQAVQVFLVVAEQGKISMKDIAEFSGMTQASVSRLTMLMGDRTRQGREGLKLVTTEDDPQDWRRKLVALTPKGKRLANEVLKVLEA